jgi:hypothetical protein
MNRAEIEQAVLTEIHSLPLDKIEATLNFVLSLKNNPVKKRPLGLLKDKVEFSIEENNQALPSPAMVKQASEHEVKQHFSERWQSQFKLNDKTDDARLDYLKQRYQL